MKLRKLIALALTMLLCTSLMAPMASAAQSPSQERIDLTAAASEQANGTWDVTYTAKLTISAANAPVMTELISANKTKLDKLTFVCELSDDALKQMTVSNINYTIDNKTVFTDVEAKQNPTTKNIEITCELVGNDWSTLSVEEIANRLSGHTVTIVGTQTGVPASVVAGSLPTQARIGIYVNGKLFAIPTDDSNSGYAAYGETKSMSKTYYSDDDDDDSSSGGAAETPAIEVVQTDTQTGDVTQTPNGSGYANVGGTVSVTAAGSSSAPKAGTRANVAVKTNPGKTITGVVVKDANGNVIPVTYTGDGNYTFTMPSGKVTVDVEYENAPYTPEESGVDSLLNTEDHIAYAKGVSGGKWLPMNAITRAEVATMLYRLLRDQNVESVVSFSDVKENTWYTDAVKALASLGIIKGYEDGTFRPSATITRAEFVSICVRFATTTPTTGNREFADVLASNWAHDNIALASALGWVVGYPEGSFKPNNALNRAEAVTIINRVLGRPGDLNAMKAGKGVSFSDVPASFWGYAAITESATPHNYTFDNGTFTETWVNG